MEKKKENKKQTNKQLQAFRMSPDLDLWMYYVTSIVGAAPQYNKMIKQTLYVRTGDNDIHRMHK